MPTIVSICPYCRAGGVRAPQSNIGASATCPNCKSSFTVMPSDGLPGWAKEREATPSAPPPAPTRSPAVEETRPAAAMGLADVTEPSPVLPADELPVPTSRPSPPPVTEMEEPAAPADMGLVMALGALILVGIAVVATQFPFGRIIAAVIAVVGLLGGLGALGAEGRAKLAGGLAIGLHGLILLVVVALPSWLNLDPWRGPPEPDVPQGPVALAHGASRGSRPVEATEWLDAARLSWEFKDVRVTVRSAHVGPVELSGPAGTKRMPKTQYLHLRLRVVNSGVERDIPLSGWAAGRNADSIRVVDPKGAVLKPAAFEESWQPERGKPSERLFPDQSSEVTLYFAAPSGKVEWLRVELPGSAVGLNEAIRFQVGSGFFTRPAVR
jgi:hypothetical protein